MKACRQEFDDYQIAIAQDRMNRQHSEIVPLDANITFEDPREIETRALACQAQEDLEEAAREWYASASKAEIDDAEKGTDYGPVRYRPF